MKKLVPSQEELIILLKAKDRKGFDILYDRYAKCLYSITYRIVHSKEIADDVIQDSFIKIWAGIDTYDSSKGTLFTWILNITRNSAIDKTRSLSYKKRSQTITIDVPTVDKQLFVQESVDCIGLDRYLMALAPQHQAVVNYVYLKGYTHEETASALRIPLGTAKSRLKTAIGLLRKLLNQ